jgi:hypothetical protein
MSNRTGQRVDCVTANLEKRLRGTQRGRVFTHIQDQATKVLQPSFTDLEFLIISQSPLILQSVALQSTGRRSYSH